MDSRKEYAARYDAMAQKLYQIAVYLTGDAFEARRAIAACFVSGLDAVSRRNEPFETVMLGELYQCCKHCAVTYKEQYCQKLAETLAPIQPNERLSALLCDLQLWERAVILSVFFGGVTSDQLHKLVEQTPAKTALTLRTFFSRAKKSALCRS